MSLYEAKLAAGVAVTIGLYSVIFRENKLYRLFEHMFLGLAAVLYIIQDFNVGPSSDLAAYEQVVGLFPAQIWMFIWLGFAAMMFYWNLKDIFQASR